MFTPTTDSMNRGPSGPRRREERTTSDRRRGRLRDLCDEVLASYRVARGQETVNEEERREAKELLKVLAPLK